MILLHGAPPPSRMGDCAKAFAFVLLVLTAGAVLFIGLDGEDSYASAGDTFPATNDDGVDIEYKILTEGTGTEHGTVQVGDGQMHSAAVNVKIPSMVEFGGRTYDVIGIGSYAVDGCSSLTSITIPDGVTSIGDWAFDGCSSLTSIDVDEQNEEYADVDGVLFSKDMAKLIQFPAAKGGAYEIQYGVTSIGGWAFYGCSSLTSVTIPDGVTSIGDDAFEGCSSLTSVTIPHSVTSIGYAAFYGCSSLTTVTIPDSVSIRDGAFDGVCNGDKAAPGAKVGHTLTLIPEGSICQSREPGTYYECETCGTLFKMADGIPTKVDDDSLSKHSMTLYDSVKEPTCTEPGHKACYQCSVCGKYFEDSEGMKGIPDLEAWRSEEGAGYIGPAGHVFGDDGVCTVCGFEEGADPEPDPSGPGQSDPGTSEPPSDPDDGSPGDGNTTLYVGIGAVAAVIIAVGAFLFLRGRS